MEAGGASPVLIRRLERKHDPKQWTQLFANTVRNKLDLRDQKLQERREDRMHMFDDDNESVYTMTTLSVRTNNSRAFLTTGSPRSKLLAKLGNKKTADVLLEQPPRLPTWHPHWGNQLLCYLCCQPALHSSVGCESCNNIAHVRCVQEIGREVPDARSHCLQCLDQHNSDKLAYEGRLQLFKEDLMRNHCASIIGRRIRVFLERRRFLRKRASIKKLQAIARGNYYHKNFYKQMRGKLRLILLQVAPQFHLEYSNMEFLNHVLVTITVFDPHKNIQYFRMERLYWSLQETAVTLPGVNYFMSVIFTFAVRDETKAYVILGQTQFSLGDIVHPAQPTVVDLRLSPRVTWMPQEAFGIKFAHLITTGRINQLLRRFREELCLQVRYLPQNPVTTSCQYIHGPPLDVLRRGGDMNRHSQSKHTDSLQPNHGPHGKGSRAGMGGNATEVGKPSSSSTAAASASAAAVAAAQSSGNYRASQYWMILYNLRLLFYQFHGDMEPRFSLELQDVNIILSKEVGRTYCMVSLQFSDGRIWHLEFNDRKSAVLFDTAVLESKKALRENNSIYMRQDDFSDDVSIGFR